MDEGTDDAAGPGLERLMKLIARLRAPGGCPWDREQTHASLKPMTIEEAYEVVEAIDHGDEELAGELGDLLLQVVFHAQIAAETRRFTLGDVIRRVSEKMVRRHPHVFGDDGATTTAQVLRNWEALKQQERRARGEAPAAESLLDPVSRSLPALMEAYQMSTKASRVGFDWKSPTDVLAKLDEERCELDAALGHERPDARELEGEIGDLLFVTVNLARKLGLDPESALKSANRKFRERFRHIEQRLQERGRDPAGSTLEEMDALWTAAKVAERVRGGRD